MISLKLSNETRLGFVKLRKPDHHSKVRDHHGLECLEEVSALADPTTKA